MTNFYKVQSGRVQGYYMENSGTFTSTDFYADGYGNPCHYDGSPIKMSNVFVEIVLRDRVIRLHKFENVRFFAVVLS